MHARADLHAHRDLSPELFARGEPLDRTLLIRPSLTLLQLQATLLLLSLVPLLSLFQSHPGSACLMLVLLVAGMHPPRSAQPRAVQFDARAGEFIAPDPSGKLLRWHLDSPRCWRSAAILILALRTSQPPYRRHQLVLSRDALAADDFAWLSLALMLNTTTHNPGSSISIRLK